jgi:hypothetical protein
VSLPVGLEATVSAVAASTKLRGGPHGRFVLGRLRRLLVPVWTAGRGLDGRAGGAG